MGVRADVWKETWTSDDSEMEAVRDDMTMLFALATAEARSPITAEQVREAIRMRSTDLFISLLTLALAPSSRSAGACRDAMTLLPSRRPLGKLGTDETSTRCASPHEGWANSRWACQAVW